MAKLLQGFTVGTLLFFGSVLIVLGLLHSAPLQVVIGVLQLAMAYVMSLREDYRERTA